MMTFLAILHLLVAVMLILLVLIQDSKGDAMGSMLGSGGGNANSLLGATGATSFLVKLTRAVAVVFAGTCIALTIISSQKSKSVIEGYVPPPAAQKADTEPAAPDKNGSPENPKKDDTATEKK